MSCGGRTSDNILAALRWGAQLESDESGYLLKTFLNKALNVGLNSFLLLIAKSETYVVGGGGAVIVKQKVTRTK